MNADYIGLEYRLSGTDFLLPDHELWIGHEDIGLPVEGFTNLYLLSQGNIIKRIEKRRDLIHHVSITLPEVALQYVRLFTSPATVHKFDEPPMLELVKRSSINNHFLFGRRDYPDRGFLIPDLKSEFRVFGILTPVEWQENALREPEVEISGHSFIVKRTVFFLPSVGKVWTDKWHWVSETVSGDGVIVRKKGPEMRLKGRILLRMDWIY